MWILFKFRPRNRLLKDKNAAWKGNQYLFMAEWDEERGPRRRAPPFLAGGNYDNGWIWCRGVQEGMCFGIGPVFFSGTGTTFGDVILVLFAFVKMRVICQERNGERPKTKISDRCHHGG